MKPALKIRPLADTDFDALDKWFGPKTVFKKPRERWVEYLQDVKKQWRVVLVAETKGQVIAYATLHLKPAYPPFKKAKIPEVQDLNVAAPHRRQGVARQLIARLERVARAQGCAAIGIGVGLYADYGSAQRLYVKLGYIPDGRGVMYNHRAVTPGTSYSIDDELVLYFTKAL